VTASSENQYNIQQQATAMSTNLVSFLPLGFGAHLHLQR